MATLQSPETTFYVASNGLASSVDTHAPQFSLTDQHGRPFTFLAHPGRYTILTFLDPVCTTDCSLMAAQLKAARATLPTDAPLDIVAVAANPQHETLADVQHFVKARHLDSVPHFSFVTGQLAALQAVWHSYGISVLPAKKGVMSVHADYLFIIDTHGHLRWIMPDDPYNGARALQVSDEAEIVSLLAAVGLH
jgi:cytochrome oxidase Cu insertion factor (SCO1/SenC/PrrC family)